MCTICLSGGIELKLGPPPERQRPRKSTFGFQRISGAARQGRRGRRGRRERLGREGRLGRDGQAPERARNAEAGRLRLSSPYTVIYKLNPDSTRIRAC